MRDYAYAIFTGRITNEEAIASIFMPQRSYGPALQGVLAGREGEETAKQHCLHCSCSFVDYEVLD